MFMLRAIYSYLLLIILAFDINGRPNEEEILYFVLPDRFSNGNIHNDRGFYSGTIKDHGFDPTNKGYYHGGDIEGLSNKLPYIKKLGVTAIWLAPIYKNKVLQGPPHDDSTGYHGYWTTDFYQVDPHFGTNEEFKNFVIKAHNIGLKVYLDTIINHTADIIKIEQCQTLEEPYKYCPYQYFADSSEGDNNRYRPIIFPNEPVKNPPELNDPILYNNRGDSNWYGEGSVYGDFSGLDDLDTTNPKVLKLMLEIHKFWISEFGIDGFRIDTVRHVNDSFWHQFLPEIYQFAESIGKKNFYIFGESAYPEVELLASYQKRSGFTHLLDFPFSRSSIDFLTEKISGHEFQNIFAADNVYKGGEKTVRQFPTFISNHDHGRIGHFLYKEDSFSQKVIEQKTILANVLLFTVRGVPTIYYGDEQGFVGDGWDKDAREDMFPSKVLSYVDNPTILGPSSEEDNFNEQHPLYLTISKLSELRKSSTALKYGSQKTVFASGNSGLYIFKRSSKNQTVLIGLNNSSEKWKGNLLIETNFSEIEDWHGVCSNKWDSKSKTLKNLDINSYEYFICIFE